MPPEFVEEKHALEWLVRLGLLVMLVREVWRQDYAGGVLRRRFQIVRIDLHRHALHDHVQREHNPKVVLLADQHAFHPHHGSGLDANPLADDKVGVGSIFRCPRPERSASISKSGSGARVRPKPTSDSTPGTSSTLTRSRG